MFKSLKCIFGFHDWVYSKATTYLDNSYDKDGRPSVELIKICGNCGKIYNKIYYDLGTRLEAQKVSDILNKNFETQKENKNARNQSR